MIRHIVMFKLLEEADGRTKAENALIIKEKLEALQGVVPTLLSSQVVLGVQGSAPSNYDVALIAEYADMDALNEYVVHPAHKKVGEFIAKVRESRACIDFEI